MRQTRQSSANASTQQAFSMTSPTDAMMDDAAGYDMMPAGSYMHEAHASPTLTSAHRRPRTQEGVDPRKPWPRAY